MFLASLSLLLFTVAEYTTSPEYMDPVEPSLVEDWWKKKGWYTGGGGYTITYGTDTNGGGQGYTSVFYSVITQTATVENPVTEYITLPGFTSTLSYIPQTEVTTIHHVQTSVITVYAAANAGVSNARTTSR